MRILICYVKILNNSSMVDLIINVGASGKDTTNKITPMITFTR